jgi:hypothetical protein
MKEEKREQRDHWQSVEGESSSCLSISNYCNPSRREGNMYIASTIYYVGE